MDDDSDRSSEETHFEILTRDKKTYADNNNNNDDNNNNKEEDEEDSDHTVNEDKYDNDATDDDDQREVSDMETSRMEIVEYYSRSCETETETLAVSGLAEVPVQYEVRHDELEQLKNQLQGSHQEALAVVIAQAAQTHSGNNPSLTSEFSPQSSSIPRLNSKGDILSTESNQRINSDSKTVSTSRTVKTPIDGYNWRKYGQKQVKSPQGSRSYFKCTHNECDAKKIESCDQYNSITKIVYKGQHKHDPPKKVYSRRGKILSPSSRGKDRKMISTSASKQHKSSGSVGNGLILVEEMDAPPPKPRVKKNSSVSSGSVLKPPKKPKFVIHAASDVGISADGYRWRKYGQKMVKGNPHPRNYYKCTSAGCPVRKHTEMAVDSSSEVILTYKGIHDHDLPTPTKDQPPPTVLLTAVSSPSKNNNSQSNKGETDPSNGVLNNKIKA